MISPALNHILRFLALLLLQVFVLNNVVLTGIFNPYVYIYFLLLLPMNMPRAWLLIVAFLAGLTLDFFTHSIGIHAFVCVLIAFIRPFLIDIVQPPGGYSPDDRPTIGSMGFRWFLNYSLPLVFVYHLVLFLVETLSVNQIGFVLLKASISALIAEVIIVLFEFFFSKRTR
jgi:hypothetical protein